MCQQLSNKPIGAQKEVHVFSVSAEDKTFWTDIGGRAGYIRYLGLLSNLCLHHCFLSYPQWLPGLALLLAVLGVPRSDWLSLADSRGLTAALTDGLN